VSDLGTIRERIQRAASYFHRQEGVVLTTFNLSAAFLEEQALPVILGVEAKTVAARRAETHQRLGATPCSVFYDPTVPPRLSGRYRFVARPVPMRGRFFHPKLVVIAGRAEDDTTWVYLAVSSANLSLSGWGRNAESFGETWIHTRQQQTWGALDGFLAWLQARAPLGEAEAEADAVARVRAALARMPNRKRLRDDGTAPWSGTLYAQAFNPSPGRRPVVLGDVATDLKQVLLRAPRPDQLHSASRGPNSASRSLPSCSSLITRPASMSAMPSDTASRNASRSRIRSNSIGDITTQAGRPFWVMTSGFRRPGKALMMLAAFALNSPSGTMSSEILSGFMRPPVHGISGGLNIVQKQTTSKRELVSMGGV